MVDELLQYIAPHHCFGCGKTGTVLCSNCKYDIVDETFSGCIVCAGPSLVGICSTCKTTYEKAWCVGDRSGTLERLIDAYKFERVKRASVELAELLDKIVPVLPPETIVIPVPTVQSHIRVRGYDHALLLARQLARRRKLKILPVIKRVNTASQHELGRKERFKNATQAFKCGGLLRDVPYLLVDDITTSGATLQYTAAALKAAGAKEVWVAVVAKQVIK